MTYKSNLLYTSSCPKCGGAWGALQWVAVLKKLEITCGTCLYGEMRQPLDQKRDA